MGKVTFKPGYQDFGAYPLLQTIINAGGLEAEGGFNTTLTEDSVVNTDNFNLLIGNQIPPNIINGFISGYSAPVNFSALFSADDTPTKLGSISNVYSGSGGDILISFETLAEYLGDTYYKSFTSEVNGTTGLSTMSVTCSKNFSDFAILEFDSFSYNSFAHIAPNNYYRTYLFSADNSSSVLFFGLTTTGRIQVTLQTYADDIAADADAGLPSGGLYLLTGDRTVYAKP